MDILATIGSLAASEGANAISILTPAQLPPGHISWNSKDIASADETFARNETAQVSAQGKEQPSLAMTMLATGACLVAWKEATFDTTSRKTTKDEEKELPK
jgi:hypothetical protein